MKPFSITIGSLATLRQDIERLVEKLDLKNPSPFSNCLAFYGEMGSGKTTIIKQICKSLDVVDNTSSPSFSLINEYKSLENKSIYHFDFYRLNHADEAYDLGYEEYFYSNQLCLIEWPEKVEPLLPVPHIRIDILIAEKNERIIEVKVVS
jgi:tRNA threonylcarbamoyladenosine biosynthesis protein TsaE